MNCGVEVQAQALTVPTAQAVHAAVTAYAEAHGLDRVDVEMRVKKAVRYAEG